MQRVLKVRFVEKAKQFIVTEDTIHRYFQLVDTQAIQLFLPNTYTYQIVDESEPADICIVGIQHTDNSLLRPDEYNLFVSVENFSVGRTHYNHWNTFQRSGNPMITTYIYNDAPHPTEHCIPAVYCRMRYFQIIYPQFEHIRRAAPPFAHRKFCLFTSRNPLNSNKHAAVRQIRRLGLGGIDFLDKYDDILRDKTCYNSPELLSVYSQYKFIICFENSTSPGYVTEKIFNVFAAGAIPIYDGAPNIADYLFPDSFVPYTDNMVQTVAFLAKDPRAFYKMLATEKIKEVDTSCMEMQLNTFLERASPTAKCFIGGCVKDCAPYLDRVFANIRKAGALFDAYHVIIAYDHSDDDTLALLEIQQAEIVRAGHTMDICINPNPTTPVRTQNIANARNQILREIKERYTPEWKFFVMMDCDDVCSSDLCTDVLAPYLPRLDWDALSFNRPSYYDIWALSFDPYVFSCWNWPNSVEVIEKMRSTIVQKLHDLLEGELLPCYSAFNGFAIYRTAKFLNCTYEWNPPMHLFRREQLEENIRVVGQRPFLREANDDCEHRSFHLQAIAKNQAKIRISPQYLFSVDK